MFKLCDFHKLRRTGSPSPAGDGRLVLKCLFRGSWEEWSNSSAPCPQTMAEASCYTQNTFYPLPKGLADLKRDQGSWRSEIWTTHQIPFCPENSPSFFHPKRFRDLQLLEGCSGLYILFPYSIPSLSPSLSVSPSLKTLRQVQAWPRWLEEQRPSKTGFPVRLWARLSLVIPLKTWKPTGKQPATSLVLSTPWPAALPRAPPDLVLPRIQLLDLLFFPMQERNPFIHLCGLRATAGCFSGW